MFGLITKNEKKKQMSKFNQPKSNDDNVIANIIEWAKSEFKMDIGQSQLERVLIKNPLLLNHLLSYLERKCRKNDLKIQNILLRIQLNDNNQFFKSIIKNNHDDGDGDFHENQMKIIEKIKKSIENVEKFIKYINVNNLIQKPDLLPQSSSYFDHQKFEKLNDDINNQLKILFDIFNDDPINNHFDDVDENIQTICQSLTNIIGEINTIIDRIVQHSNQFIMDMDEKSNEFTSTTTLSTLSNPADHYIHMNRLKIIMNEWHRKLDSLIQIHKA